MNRALTEAQLICPDFQLTPELEVDRKLIGWWNRNRNRGVAIEDTMLCELLSITKEQYWLSVARLHYLGVMRFPVEILKK
jgi:hypothetical protein